MKRTREQPSVAGLLLILTGMLLLSIVLMGVTGRGTLSSEARMWMMGLTGAALASLAGGIVLSGRKKK